MTMPKKNRTPLVLSPRDEFECEAEMTARHCVEQMLEDPSFTRDAAIAHIADMAAHLAPFYELPADDFIAHAIKHLPEHC